MSQSTIVNTVEGQIAEIVRAGGRAPRRRTKGGIARGYFVLKAALTDNATTAGDFTAVVNSQKLLDAGGETTNPTANPRVVIGIEAMRVFLVESIETPAVIAELVNTCLIRFQTPTGKLRKLEVADFYGSLFKAISKTVKDDATLPVAACLLRDAGSYDLVELDDPEYSNLATDALEIVPPAAVDGVANINVYILCYGSYVKNTGWEDRHIDEAACVTRTPRQLIEEKAAQRAQHGQSMVAASAARLLAKG